MNDLERICRRLLAAYRAEESEHGFPFSFELREAHRELASQLRQSHDYDALLKKVAFAVEREMEYQGIPRPYPLNHRYGVARAALTALGITESA